MSGGLDLGRYLARIGYTGTLAPDLVTLQALHAAHAAAIPFEGIDPLLGRPVPIDIASVQQKLVEGGRGGYCMEQNALLQAALEAIGFRVRGLTGRVRWLSPPEAPLGPRTHRLLLVELAEGPFLADAGFGACLLDAPLRFVPGLEQRTAMGTFRLTEEAGLFHLAALQPEGWRWMYAFDLVPALESDFELGNHYAATSWNAPFRRMLIVERVDAAGRYKLLNRRLVIEARDGALRSEPPCRCRRRRSWRG